MLLLLLLLPAYDSEKAAFPQILPTYIDNLQCSVLTVVFNIVLYVLYSLWILFSDCAPVE